MNASNARDAVTDAGTDAGAGTDAKLAAATKLIGHVIGGYRLLRVLEVAEASVTLLGEHVEAPDQHAAIKILQAPSGTPTAALAALRIEFNREAQALFALQNPHLLGIYALGMDVVTGNPYMVLPHPQGGTLADRLSAGALPLEKAAVYLAQLADALDAAHAQGMMHGDVKPANVLFDGADHLFLTGFGPSVVAAKYVAPERLRGQAPDPVSDQYSLGVVLYEMVTGVVPFQGATANIVALQHAQLPPPPPRALRPDLPEQAEAVLLRALAKEPAARFPSATALAEAFARGLQGEATPGDVAALTPTVPQPQPELPPPSAAPATAVSQPTPLAQSGAPAAAARPAPAARIAEALPRVTTPAAASDSSRVVPAAAPVSAAPSPRPAPAASSASASPTPRAPATVPVRTAPTPAPRSTPGTVPAKAATSSPSTEPSRQPTASDRSAPAGKYLVPPIVIRNIMLAIFALVLGTALIAAVRALGPFELLLTVAVIGLFGYCGVILPGQAAAQEQRRTGMADAHEAL